MTSEQLEAARAERLRHNGLGTLTLDEARTWIEETGLCLFLPKKQFASSIAPSFVEAIEGHRDDTPNQKQIAVAEDLLVRLELEGVAVRLNLFGQPGEQPDFVVAAWVLPYVYALRGDRDWRRNPQLTGSRQVSQLAVQTYKSLEAGDATVSQLKHALGREVSESAVVRAITELWQQLRIIPVIEAPGKAAKWQFLRYRFQKAIAEGASTSQVTAISVLASIYLQAVIAASMEEVEVFLSPLTARSKVREVLRGLVATRQVHTITMGHAQHFYVAGTLPEFAPAQSIYSSATMSASSYFLQDEDHHTLHSPARSLTPPHLARLEPRKPAEVHAVQTEKPVPAHQASTNGHSSAPRPHSGSNGSHARDRRPNQTSSGRPARRVTESRPAAKRGASSTRPTIASRLSPAKPKSSSTRNGAHAKSNGAHANGSHRTSSNGANGHRHAKPTTWSKSNGRPASVKSNVKKSSNAAASSVNRKDSRVDARSARPARKPARAASVGAGSAKRYGFTARPNRGTKKRG